MCERWRCANKDVLPDALCACMCVSLMLERKTAEFLIYPFHSTLQQRSRTTGEQVAEVNSFVISKKLKTIAKYENRKREKVSFCKDE